MDARSMKMECAAPKVRCGDPCPGYGSQVCCPPLIVVAAHAMDAAAEERRVAEAKTSRAT